MSTISERAAAWSQRTRIVVTAVVVVVVAALVATALIFTQRTPPASGASGPVTPPSSRAAYALPAQPTGGGLASIGSQAPATGSTTVTGPVSDGSVAAGKSAVDVPAVIPLPFSSGEVGQAAKAAAGWASGVSSLRWDEDQTVRATQLRNYLDDPENSPLLQQITPTPAAVEDMVKAKRVSMATAAVRSLAGVSRGSLMFQIDITTRTTDSTGKTFKPVTTGVVITTVPKGQAWKVTSMMGAADGDPGY